MNYDKSEQTSEPKSEIEKDYAVSATFYRHPLPYFLSLAPSHEY